MKSARLFFCLLTLVIAYYSTAAQYYKSYNTSNGLVSNNVYQIKRDGSGYLWFCTDKGVVRYNGQIFDTYSIANGLTDNEVYNCYEDMQGRMWFYTFNGTFCYFKDGIIYDKNNDSLLKKLKEYSYINAMYENTDDSSLYFGHIIGPIQKLKSNVISTIPLPIDPFNKIRTITPTATGLKVYSHRDDFLLQNDKVKHRTHHELQNSFYYNNHLIISDSNGVSLYKKDNLIWQISDPDVQFGSILHLFYNGEGYVFCGTIKGLLVYNIYTGNKQQFFENTRVSSTAKDHDGNYWISTFGHGVYFFSSANLIDIRLLKNIKGYDLIKSSSGQIFLKKHDSVLILKNNATSLAFEKIRYGIPQNAEPIFNSGNKQYYYERDGGGKSYSINSLGITTQLPYNFFKIFSLTENNLALFNSNDFIHANVQNGDIQERSIFHSANRLNSQAYIKELNSIYFIVGTNILYRHTCADYTTQAIDTINNIGSCNCIFYHEGKIYVSGNNGYIHVYDTATNKMLGSIKCEAVVYDVWKTETDIFIANTDMGYKTLKIEGDSFIFSNLQYPFLQQDIMFISPYSGHIVCKAGDDLYTFSAEVLNKKIIQPRLYLHSIIVNGKRINGETVYASVKDKARIDIFLSTVYYGGNKLVYRYRITENDMQPDEWQYTQGEQLSFTIANKGEYNIEVQVAEAGSKYTDSKLVLLTITPSFINSIYFIVLCAVAGCIILLLVMRYVHKKRKIDFANEMNFLKLEHRATSATLNPHFIFNAINNIQNLINQNSKEEAREYLATLSIMIRQNIDNLQFHLIPLQKELGLIENYVELQNLRFGNNILFEIRNAVNTTCNIPPLLIQTFVENAIIHGYDKQQKNFKILVTILYTIDDYLIINITDNGRGINNTSKQGLEKEKKSIGISFTEKRLKRLSEFYKKDYTLKVEDLAAKNRHQTGTEVTIIIYARMQ